MENLSYPFMLEFHSLQILLCRGIWVNEWRNWYRVFIAPERVLAEHKVRKILWKTSGFMDFYLQKIKENFMDSQIKKVGLNPFKYGTWKRQTHLQGWSDFFAVISGAPRHYQNQRSWVVSQWLIVNVILIKKQISSSSELL